jgi:hypothetical protein
MLAKSTTIFKGQLSLIKRAGEQGCEPVTFFFGFRLFSIVFLR